MRTKIQGTVMILNTDTMKTL